MKCTLKNELSSKEIGGELFVYNRINSTISSFNGTGAYIWNLLKKNIPLDEISRLLCEEFDVSLVNSSEDVADFIKTLCDNGFVSIKPE